MTATDAGEAGSGVEALARELLERRAAPDHWQGRLSSSALSTATAVLALELAVRNGVRHGEHLGAIVGAGVAWLLQHQNADGGWGDSVRSRSNVSTTSIAWATLSTLESRGHGTATAVERAAAWLRREAGDVTPEALRAAILRRYGRDRTFSVPILTVLALTNKLGGEAAGWRSLPQLPFELAALPHAWFQHLRLPVVS